MKQEKNIFHSILNFFGRCKGRKNKVKTCSVQIAADNMENSIGDMSNKAEKIKFNESIGDNNIGL